MPSSIRLMRAPQTSKRTWLPKTISSLSELTWLPKTISSLSELTWLPKTISSLLELTWAQWKTVARTRFSNSWRRLIRGSHRDKPARRAKQSADTVFLFWSSKRLTRHLLDQNKKNAYTLPSRIHLLSGTHQQKSDHKGVSDDD